MYKQVITVLVTFILVALLPLSSEAQRRGRPGSMKHTESEVQAKKAVTQISCKYIRDGSTFEGPIYMTGEAGGIKIGDAVIVFSGGNYKLSFDAEKFKVRKYAAMTEEERIRKGISKYQYEHSWEYKKLGEDFDYGGKYATIEQYEKKWLILYDGNTDAVYAKIPIGNVNDKEFELSEDGMLIRMSCR